MKEIKLHNKYEGQVVLVDDDIFDELNIRSWQLNNSGYPSRTERVNGRAYILFMHHVIMPKIEGLQIDHINRNKLDNRRENLRYVTNEQQLANKGSHKDSLSKYKGVYYNHKNKYSKWMASISIDGKSVCLGSYDSEVVAAKAYNIASKNIHGDYAFQNDVPDDVHVPTIEERFQKRNKLIATTRKYQPKGGYIPKRLES
jgi:hypothetical protein